MVKNYLGLSSCFKPGLFLVVFLFFGFYASAQTHTDNTPGSKTFTVPCGVTSITVEAWGGGGGGQRANGKPSAGGGGSGGGYVKATIAVTAGNDYSYFVGTGGSGDPGVNGTSSWFINNTTLNAVGGKGAGPATITLGSGAVAFTTGNVGGVIENSYGGSGGNAGANNTGGGGSSGGSGSPSSNDAIGIDGGAAPTDGYAGANGRIDDGNGANGNIGAGGSGGGKIRNTDRIGGSGGNGQIRITYTSTFPTYCSPTFTSGVEPITNVTLAGIDNTTTNALGGPSLESFCDIGAVVQGTNHQISIQGNTSGNFTNHFRVFIDWNQDGDFLDAGESYYIGTIISSTGIDAKIVIGGISVPTDALLGNTRMRVMKRYNADPTNPCQTGSGFGQAEDYTINVTEPLDTYCTSYGNNTDGFNTGIRLVNFNTIDNDTPPEDNDYSDFTAISTTVTKEQSYDLTVNVNTDGDWTNYTYVWIDWNQDGDFSDPGESFDMGTATNVPNGATLNSPLPITIPATARIGSTRMRVSTKYFSAPFSCDAGFDGEVEDYTINITPPLSITTGTIAPTSYCVGASISIPYTITGTFNTGNVFTAQLSNATGSFASPTSIGTLVSTAAETISATIPGGTTAGTGYRIRVISDDPIITGSSNTSDLTINELPVSPTAGNNGPVCVGSTLNLSASTVSGAAYNWTGPNGFTSSLQNPTINNVDSSNSGDYFVTVTVNACTSETGTTNVVVITSNTWTGAQDTNWNEVNNWSCNSIPNLDLNVIIPGGLTNYPILNTGALGMAKDIQINSVDSLTIVDNTLQIAGSIANSGTINSLNGSLAFVGTVAQTIPATIFSSNRIRNLIINNTAGLSSSGDLEITGFLRVDSGNFNTGNALTLISNATQTALIDGSGSGQVLGLVTMQRYLDVAFGYKYFSSPFKNSSVGDFSPYMDLVDPVTSFPNFYTYDENRQYDADSASTGWKAYTTPSDPLGILEGYALNFGDNLTTPKTVEITGTVNNGDQQIALINNNRTYTKGFNLVGNPYPSPIDWNAVPPLNRNNIDNALYFFTAGSTDQYTGTYTSYVDGISADGRSSNIIPSMQGFFVHVTNPGNATLKFTNLVRTDNSIPQQFLKIREQERAPLIRISAGFENEAKADPAVLYFPYFAELSFEKDKDALKMMNTDISVPNLYSLTPENKKLSINALPKPGRSDEVKKIPLGLKTEKEGWMLIGLKDLENLPSNFNVYLIDSEKRIGQNLSRKPQYRFYAKSGQHESRFYLMFSETELSDPAIAFDEPFSVRTLGGKVMVSLNLKSGQSGVLLASTITGQILDRKTVSENQIIEIEGIKSSGVYFFSINLKNGMFSKKVLIQK